LIAILLATPACSSTRKVTVTCDEFAKSPNIERTINATVGGSLTVTLCSNPTTGFRWSEQATIGDPDVLYQKSHRFIEPQAKDQPIAGAPGAEEWVFTLNKTGTTTISMEYSRPWEGGEKGAWTFKLTVVVK